MRPKRKKRNLPKKADGEYKCPGCNAGYTHASTRNDHYKKRCPNNPNKDNDKFECGHCEKVFKQKRSVIAHIKAAHEQNNENVCLECGFSFTYQCHLLVHQQQTSHTN